MQSCRVSIFLNIRICSPVFYEIELLINDSQRELKNHCIFVAYLWVVIGKPKWGFRSDLVFLMIKWPSLFIIFVIQPNLFLMSISYDVKPVSNCFRVVICLNSSLEKFSWLVQRWVFYSWRSICCLNLIFIEILSISNQMDLRHMMFCRTISSVWKFPEVKVKHCGRCRWRNLKPVHVIRKILWKTK